MRRFTILSVIALCLGLFVASAGPSLAQGYAEGLMNAISYKPLPEGAVFSVQPLDNSDQNMRIKQELENLLRRKGYGVSDDAPLVISFETRDEMGTYTTRNKRAVLELDAHGGREGGEDARMRFNLFDSNSGGVFNAGKGETTVRSPSQYRLDVTIDSRETGKRHWQAWTVANLEHSDSTFLIMGMLPEMVGNLGKRVKSLIVELY